MRNLRAALKVAVFVLSGLFTMLYQTVFIALNKGPASLAYPKLYHGFLTKLLGIRIIVEGMIDRSPNIVYISNHISYMDIQVLGGLIHGSFVAKKEIEGWPFFGYLGKMGRTLYISRRPADAVRETRTMLQRIEDGLPLIIFPEGTSSNGRTILPFKSSFFEIFLNRNIRIQPVTLSILEVDGKPVRNDLIRDLYAWHGDMTLLPHLWSFFKGNGAVVKVCFQEPVLSLEYGDRKSLCSACYQRVVGGLDPGAQTEKDMLSHPAANGATTA